MPNLFKTPDAVTPEAQLIAYMAEANNALHARILNQYTTQYRALWNNQQVDPVKAIAAMGTDATKIFALSAALGQLLVSCGDTVPTSKPAGYTVTFNADGSATCAKGA